MCDLAHASRRVFFTLKPRQALPRVAVVSEDIIAFPQELAEVKQLLSFWTNVREGDVVNVELVGAPSTFARCRVVALLLQGFTVEHANGSVEDVPLERVKQRVLLPWKPEDLRDHLIILRRRNAQREEYIEDLRVRRRMLSRVLLLLTKKGDWRPGHGREALHMYYGDVGLRQTHEIQEVFPEDDVPATLNFRDVDDTEWPHELDLRTFEE